MTAEELTIEHEIDRVTRERHLRDTILGRHGFTIRRQPRWVVVDRYGCPLTNAQRKGFDFAHDALAWTASDEAAAVEPPQGDTVRPGVWTRIITAFRRLQEKVSTPEDFA